MAERMWEDQHSEALELISMSACKTFLIVELLHWVRDLYKRIAARNQLIAEAPGHTLAQRTMRNGVSDSNNPFQHCQKPVL
jgi:hypothetical protein